MRGWLFTLLAATAAFAAIASAEPVTKVGEAEVIRNEVVRVDGSTLSPIVVGDTVIRDEIVRTSADSDARIGLIDSTKLALGPNSTLKIDRAVYSGESRYKQIVISLTAGAFRFVTGNSDKKSYRIDTPTATIGVRGTILDILISENKTLVTLQEGRASVCAGNRCTQLLERGHTADVTRDGGVIQIKRDLVPTWTFASVCSNNSQLCSSLQSPTKKASLPLPKAKAPDPTRDRSLTAPNDFAGNTLAPAVAPTEQVLSTPGRIGAPSIGGVGGISVPRLGR